MSGGSLTVPLYKNNVLRTKTIAYPLLIITPVLIAFLSVCLGRYMVAPGDVFKILLSNIADIPRTWSEMDTSVVMQVRLPRIIIALLAGAAMSVAGAAMQGMLSNPLASPDTLGVASGASFGAALALLFTGNMIAVQLVAMLFGLVAMALAYIISLVRKKSSTIMIILAGVIVAAFFEALVSLVKYVADPDTKLPAITYWLMGSFANTTYKGILASLPGIVIGMGIIIALRWRINTLTLHEDEAGTLGVKVIYIRIALILASAVITSSVIALSGKIGWVGLVIPHMVRMIVGTNHKKVIPVSISIGACYLLLIDDLARCLTAAEIPISILTAVVGAPFFAVLLRKTGGSW